MKRTLAALTLFGLTITASPPATAAPAVTGQPHRPASYQLAGTTGDRSSRASAPIPAPAGSTSVK